MRTLTLAPGHNEVRFRSVVRVGGPVSYRLELDGVQNDQFAENNRFVTSLDVPGRPTVLYVEGQPARATYLASALGAQQFDVDVRSPTALPRSLAELERFDFFVLSDVPAEQVDTTGCGDAFQAAFTVAWAGGASIKEALRAGARRAAEVVRYLGAIPVAGVP